MWRALLVVGVLALVPGVGRAQLVIDKEKRTIIVPARVAPREIKDEKIKEVYPVEVIATWPYPKGRKAHETVVSFEVKPSEVHKALEGLGLKPGKPAVPGKSVATGPEVRIFLEVPVGGKAFRRVPVEKLLLDKKTKKAMPKVKWLFTGSSEAQSGDPKKPKMYGADDSGTLIAIFPVTPHTVFQSDLPLEAEKFVKLETNPEVVPPVGTVVRLVIVAPAP